jgi:hypothetical protein
MRPPTDNFALLVILQADLCSVTQLQTRDPKKLIEVTRRTSRSARIVGKDAGSAWKDFAHGM